MLPYLPPHLRVFAVTQRGHGDSARPQTGYDTSDFTADLEAFLDAVGLEAAVLVGGSSGGLAARRFALDHPERTEGLVFLGSPATLHGKGAMLELWDTEISNLSDPMDPKFVRAFLAGTTAKPVPAEFLGAMEGESLKVPARVWAAVFRGLRRDESVHELSALKASTLIVWGDADSIVSYEDQQAMAAAIADSRLVVIPGAGHALYWEDPQRVARELSEFAGGLALSCK